MWWSSLISNFGLSIPYPLGCGAKAGQGVTSERRNGAMVRFTDKRQWAGIGSRWRAIAVAACLVAGVGLLEFELN